MKASTYTILLCAWACLFGSVMSISPAMALALVQKLVDNWRLFQLICAAWFVLSVLVLVRPRASDLFEESVVRVIAWFASIKCVSVCFLYNLIQWWIEMIKAHADLLRFMGLVDLLIGLWMFFLARKMMSQPTQGDDPTPE